MSFCMYQSTDYPKYLGDFYYGGTLILQCIKQLATIPNWVTFCGSGLDSLAARCLAWICVLSLCMNLAKMFSQKYFFDNFKFRNTLFSCFLGKMIIEWRGSFGYVWFHRKEDCDNLKGVSPYSDKIKLAASLQVARSLC